jgi:predicted membrane channel-forming protein YqfA (hemolysin III family)
MDLIGLLVTVVILALVFWLVYWLLTLIPLPEPFKTVVTVLLGLLGVIILLSLLFGGISLPHLHWR